MDANTVILPGYKAEVDPVGNLLIWELDSNAQVGNIAALQKLDTTTVDIFENALANARNEIDKLLAPNCKAASAIIAGMPDKPSYFEDWIDDDGQGVGPWKVACTLNKKGGRLEFDFTRTDSQSASSINFYLSTAIFKMFVGIYFLIVYDSGVVANEGLYDLLDVYIPEGTLLRPIRPAALSCRTHFLGRLMEFLSAVSGLLGQERLNS